MDGIVFTTDREGVIQDIGENNWNLFASENGAPELMAEAIVGRCLFDFISGSQVRDALQRIMGRVSEDPNWSWVIPCSCDAPARKRHQRQCLRPVFSETDCVGFLFQTVEIGSQQRPPIGLFDFKRLRGFAEVGIERPTVLMCSWCQRVCYEPISMDNWISAEDYYAASGSSDVQLSHGICDDCEPPIRDL